MIGLKHIIIDHNTCIFEGYFAFVNKRIEHIQDLDLSIVIKSLSQKPVEL